MRKYYKRSTQKLVFYCALTLAVVVLLVILFANLKSVPSINKSSVKTDVSDCTVKVLDVGQGDSILISSRGRTALIDAGTPESAQSLFEKITSFGAKRLDVMLLTHNHDDHIGGAHLLAQRFSVENLILPNLLNTESKTRIVNDAKSEVLASEGDCYTAKRGMYMNIGDVKLSVLAAYNDLSDENERSVVTVAEVAGYRFLLTGDAGKDCENLMLKENINIDCDVLKVGHHGSSGATTKKFLERCTPEYAAISCGENNQYSHPHAAALERLENAGVTVYRTDISGDITFLVENGKLNVSTEK